MWIEFRAKQKREAVVEYGLPVAPGRTRWIEWCRSIDWREAKGVGWKDLNIWKIFR